MNRRFKLLSTVLAVLFCITVIFSEHSPRAAEPRSVSGIYPHLAFFNEGNECGTGAVVPWAGRLWAITYSPHRPNGSLDKLYEIDPNLKIVVRPESIGGTPANRMIHRESGQLFIGPYVIDERRNVRVIPPSRMPGRLTGTARHLNDPKNKIYYATMEEGFYEVDVHSLAVKVLYPDNQGQIRYSAHAPPSQRMDLPGYHGKGLYSGQSRLVYANNGEPGSEALRRPDILSGCLAEWNGTDWNVIRRNQFTEVSGPGGIHGNLDPDNDPVWSIGWDHRSLILALLDRGEWQIYRLPKATHTYDGAHGWNTEWPRIRDIGERDLLMTMHGMFWQFPKMFSSANSGGIAPLSTYLKVVGDFCRWNDRIVFGCDDAAKSEFLNKRRAKGEIAAPGQSQSNLWLVEPSQLNAFGPAIGRGAVWLDETIVANTPSDPFSFSGFERRAVHLTHNSKESVTFSFEVDRDGNAQWAKLRDVKLPPNGYQWIEFDVREAGSWIRIRTDRNCEKATAFFSYSNKDNRPTEAGRRFDGLALSHDKNVSAGLIRSRGENLRTLGLAASIAKDGIVSESGFYELDGSLNLRRIEDDKAHEWLKGNVQVPQGILTVDDASILYIDDKGNRWRLPKGDPSFNTPGIFGDERIAREVVTERDLFNCHGTFYELPALNAGGFAKIRPIATHNRRIHDFCSYRGLLVMTGISVSATDSAHIIRSNDGNAAVWVGAVDDLWQLGKPGGVGGPWSNSSVKAHEPSDPYLMAGYDRKSLLLSHNANQPVRFFVQVDLAGTGLWRTWRKYTVDVGKKVADLFPPGFNAYWVRIVADKDCEAAAIFDYR